MSEIKSATRLTVDHFRVLEHVKSDFPKSRRIVTYRGKEPRRLGSGPGSRNRRAAYFEVNGRLARQILAR